MLKKITAVLFGFLFMLLGLMSQAHAALDPAVATALESVKDDATSLSGIVMPIVIAILGMMITIKLVKRFGNKI